MDFDQILSFGDFVVGTCQSMCPEEERLLREKENLLHPLEVLESKEGPCQVNHVPRGRKKRNVRNQLADPAKTVKCYSRPAAGQKVPDPSELRPAPVLLETVDYLISKVVCRDIRSPYWVERYNFVADRLRSIRQDMVIQGLQPEVCRQLLEPMVKFHVFSAYWLCESPLCDFDPTLNKMFLMECLKRLLSTYDYQRNKGCVKSCREPQGSSESSNRGSKNDGSSVLFCDCEQHLMEALYLMVNLGDSHALSRSLLQDRSCFGENFKCLQQKVTEISLAWQNGNYVSVCRHLKELPPLVIMAAILHLPTIHRYALMVMNTAYSSKAQSVPSTYLLEILLWPSAIDVVNECSHYGIQCHPTDAGSSISFFKGNFLMNAKLYPSLRIPWIDRDMTPENLLKIFCLQML